MRLEDCAMVALLPGWMQQDADVGALASVVDTVAQEAYLKSQLLTIWDKIDVLPEGTLDELAWALDIEWWDSTAAIDVKRSLIKNSDMVHARKGTPAAVESVIDSYFGSGRLMEWDEYGGEPYHFKAFTTNPTLVAENQTLFLALMEKVKRESTKLDAILIGLTGEMRLYAGAAVRNHDRMVQALGQGDMFVVTDMAIIQTDHISVRITAGATLGE